MFFDYDALYIAKRQAQYKEDNELLARKRSTTEVELLNDRSTVQLSSVPEVPFSHFL